MDKVNDNYPLHKVSLDSHSQKVYLQSRVFLEYPFAYFPAKKKLKIAVYVVAYPEYEKLGQDIHVLE